MTWPHNIPVDLRPRLAAAMSMRNCGPAEVWGEIRDWLEKHKVEMPEEIKTEQPLDGAQRDQ